MAEERPDLQLVRLTLANTPQEAHVIATMLEGEGIHAKVVGDYLAAGLGDIAPTDAEVWVARDDLARATALLAAVQEHAAHDEEE